MSPRQRVGRLCDFLIDSEVLAGDEVIDDGFGKVVAQQGVDDGNKLSKQTIVVCRLCNLRFYGRALPLSAPFSGHERLRVGVSSARVSLSPKALASWYNGLSARSSSSTFAVR